MKACGRGQWTSNVILGLFAGFALNVGLAGCQTTGGSTQQQDVSIVTTTVNDRPGASSNRPDPRAQTSLNTASPESDVYADCADKIVSRMMANPIIMSSTTPRHVVVDEQFVRSDTTTFRFPKKMFTDRLRSALLLSANKNGAQAKLRFVGRQEQMAAAQEEQALRDDGTVGAGTTPSSSKLLGADYRLTGSVQEFVVRDGATEHKTVTFTFEMVDVNTSEIVFNDFYEFKGEQRISRLYR